MINKFFPISLRLSDVQFILRCLYTCHGHEIRVYLVATLVNSKISGFKFRPYIQNPYYKLVNEDEDDLEMSAVPDGDHDTLRNRAARPESSDGDI